MTGCQFRFMELQVIERELHNKTCEDMEVTEILTCFEERFTEAKATQDSKKQIPKKKLNKNLTTQAQKEW